MTKLSVINDLVNDKKLKYRSL